MLFLLRKIRRKLLSQNKVTSYLFYAVGEIILVVVGILIAISIDNWNHKNNETAQEQIILRQLQAEYAENLKQLEEKMYMRNQMLEAANRILSYIDNPSGVHRDSLIFDIGMVIRDPTFDPIQNDLIASGNIRLIRNDTLRKILSNWTSDVYQVQEIELEWQKIRSEFINPFTIEIGIQRDIADIIWKDGYTPVEALDQNISIVNKVGPSKKAPSTREILQNRELEGIAAITITYSQIGNIQSQALRDRILLINNYISQDLH
ncbi:DUF6090 family protein [Ekhidna sp.]|uniref:DUF6090 family protein n=1 Tax=Ekhidna sp. TaxID=2608089 RepID=UPI003BAB234D